MREVSIGSSSLKVYFEKVKWLKIFNFCKEQTDKLEPQKEKKLDFQKKLSDTFVAAVVAKKIQTENIWLPLLTKQQTKVKMCNFFLDFRTQKKGT